MLEFVSLLTFRIQYKTLPWVEICIVSNVVGIFLFLFLLLYTFTYGGQVWWIYFKNRNTHKLLLLSVLINLLCSSPVKHWHRSKHPRAGIQKHATYKTPHRASQFLERKDSVAFPLQALVCISSNDSLQLCLSTRKGSATLLSLAFPTG